MKSLPFFLLLFLVSCKKDIPSDINPMNRVIEAIGSDDKIASENWNEEYLRLVNEHRRELGLGDFTESSEMKLASDQHTSGMASGKVPFGHKGSTERCALIKEALGGGDLCGEIVARGQKSPQEVFDAWMASPTHRQKLESSRYSHTAFSFTKSSDGTLFWMQFFLEI